MCSRPSPLQGQRQETGLVTDPALAAHNELGIIIFIRNMPISTTEEALYMLFAKHGTVRKVSIPTNSRYARSLLGFHFTDYSPQRASFMMCSYAEKRISLLSNQLLGRNRSCINCVLLAHSHRTNQIPPFTTTNVTVSSYRLCIGSVLSSGLVRLIHEAMSYWMCNHEIKD